MFRQIPFNGTSLPLLKHTPLSSGRVLRHFQGLMLDEKEQSMALHLQRFHVQVSGH